RIHRTPLTSINVLLTTVGVSSRANSRSELPQSLAQNRCMEIAVPSCDGTALDGIWRYGDFVSESWRSAAANPAARARRSVGREGQSPRRRSNPRRISRLSRDHDQAGGSNAASERARAEKGSSLAMRNAGTGKGELDS